MNHSVPRISGLFAAIAFVTGVNANPIVLQPHDPVKVVVTGSKPVTADHGSVVVTDASTTGDTNSAQQFKAAVFPQRYSLTGDHVQSNASVQVSGPGGLGNHVVLERGILVADVENLPLEIPEQAGNQGDIELIQPRGRPYPLTTIRSIGAGAEGSIILVATTVGIITPVDPMAASSTVDVVMLYLSGNDASMLHPMEEEATPTGTRFVVSPGGSLAGNRRDLEFISVSITTDANGAVTVGTPVTLQLADHNKIRALRDVFAKSLNANGADFWTPGL